MLARMLIGRGILNALFGLYFLLAAASAPGDTFRHAGYYLAADGLLALAMTYVVLRQHSASELTGVLFGSALARIALGLWFLLVPQLTTRVLASVLVLLLLALGALCLGAAELALAFTVARRGPAFGAIAVSAGISIVAAIALYRAFPDPESLRLVFAAYALAQGAVLAIAGARGINRLDLGPTS